MVAICSPACGGGGCSWVEHQRMGASLVADRRVRPLWGCGKWVGGWLEVETRYWVVRLHALPGSCFCRGWGCVAGPPRCFLHVVWVVVVWGCFLRTA
jgi:hypothetical protein